MNAMLIRILLLLNLAAGGASAVAAASDAPRLELVESFPIETTLENPDLREAHEVWLEMITAASSTLDFEEFYAANAPGSRLEDVVGAIEAAASRGVRVRFIADQRFEETYPGTLARLAGHASTEVRILDTESLMGGVQHAKFFIVDGAELYVGSQNFDWRALEHIQELGIRLRQSSVVRAFQDVFETDWALAAGADPSFRAARSTPANAFPAAAMSGGDSVLITPALSPRDWLPDPSLWDLPRIVALIDGARESVRLQLLTYKAVGRDDRYFPELESALRDAAARGVSVQILLAHWSQRRGTIEGLKSLQALPGIEVRLLTIPEWSGGFVPFARVSHAKFLVADGERAWIGTSNWEKSYFFTSRNTGLVIEGAAVAARLDRYFENGWLSPYADAVDLCRDYPAPRIAE